MAEDPGQIREAIEQTRADIGETVQAIGDKADVKGRAAQKAAARRDQLKKTSSQAQIKLAEMGRQVQAQPARGGPPRGHCRRRGGRGGGVGRHQMVWRRQPWLVWATAAAASLVVVARLLRRGHD